MSIKKGDSKYDANFTAGGLLLNEFLNLQAKYQESMNMNLSLQEEVEKLKAKIDDQNQTITAKD